MGYAHPLAFKNVDEEHINKVEHFIKVKLSDEFFKRPSQSREYLFGKTYAHEPTKFEFLPGERLLIRELVTHVQMIVDKGGRNKGLQHFQDPVNSIQIISHEKTSSEMKNKFLDSQTHYLLGKLLEAANRNSAYKKGGWRYDSQIKRYAAYLRMICGPLAYETIQRNLECALPSLSSTNRYIKSANCHITEGILRTEELLIYLKERNLPLTVAISEDATRIIGRVQYDAASNQLVGFTLPLSRSNGMPIPYSFPARSAQEMYNHFTGDISVSNLLNVVMAQPIANAKPFCLIAFGSDNVYSSGDVSKRWKFITIELEKIGVKVLTISSDSDPRYNAAMRSLSKLGCGKGVHVVWFSCDGEISGPFFVQDTVHNGTKLRNLLLRTISNEKRLPFGKYFINWNHLKILLNEFTKDEHLLTASVLNPVDRQNFHSVLRMCDPRVIALLKSHVIGSEGTVLYLQMTGDIIDAFLDQSLKPLQRVRKLWYPIFIIRMWRQFINSNNKHTIKENFLTGPCYSSLEINAHSLIMCISYLKEIDRPDLFLPHLFESQPCESLFRQLRSFTSTYSTVANCTVKEALSRISKIQLQNDIIHGTSSHFVYPRLSKQQKSIENYYHLPTRNEIVAEIQNCQRDAFTKAKSLGLIPNQRSTDFSCKVPPYSSNDRGNIKKNKIQKNVNKTPFNSPNFNNIQLKNFADKLNREIDANSPYVKIITDDGKEIIVKKMSLCWLWRAESRKLSSDRLLRVQYSAKTDVIIRKKRNVKKATFYPYTNICKKNKQR